MDATEQTFWISFISIVSGMFVISVKYCLKSKCDLVECWGIKIHRNTEQELTENPDTPSLNRQFSRV